VSRSGSVATGLSARTRPRRWAGRGPGAAIPPAGYLTRGQAEQALRLLLASEGAAVKATRGVTFGEAADAYVAALEARIRSGSFRASTLQTYVNILKRDLRPHWDGRPIAGVTRDEIVVFQARLASRNLAPSTVNQTRAIVRGVFAVAAERFGLEDDVSIAFKRAKTRRATSDKISF
jgi:hypothetical protein